MSAVYFKLVLYWVFSRVLRCFTGCFLAIITSHQVSLFIGGRESSLIFGGQRMAVYVYRKKCVRSKFGSPCQFSEKIVGGSSFSF